MKTFIFFFITYKIILKTHNKCCFTASVVQKYKQKVQASRYSIHKVIFTDQVNLLHNTRISVWNWGKLLRKQHKNCRGYKRLGVTKAKRTKSITISPRPPTNHLHYASAGTGSYCLQCSERGAWKSEQVSQHDYNSLATTAVYRRQVNTVIWMALSTVLPFPENIASRWESLLVRKCRQLRN